MKPFISSIGSTFGPLSTAFQIGAIAQANIATNESVQREIQRDTQRIHDQIEEQPHEGLQAFWHMQNEELQKKMREELINDQFEEEKVEDSIEPSAEQQYRENQLIEQQEEQVIESIVETPESILQDIRQYVSDQSLLRQIEDNREEALQVVNRQAIIVQQQQPTISRAEIINKAIQLAVPILQSLFYMWLRDQEQNYIYGQDPKKDIRSDDMSVIKEDLKRLPSHCTAQILVDPITGKRYAKITCVADYERNTYDRYYS